MHGHVGTERERCWKYGDAKVLSTATTMRPSPERSAAIAAMSARLSNGLVGVSIQIIRVFGRIAAFTAARSRMVHVREIQAVAREHAREEAVRPAIEIFGDDDVIAGREHVERSRRRRHAAGERAAERRVFE